MNVKARKTKEGNRAIVGVTAQEAHLTEREWEVLALVAQGKRNREIAQELCICEKTVEYHVTNILGKLRLPNRTAAAVWALRTGLIPRAHGGGGGRCIGRFSRQN